MAHARMTSNKSPASRLAWRIIPPVWSSIDSKGVRGRLIISPFVRLLSLLIAFHPARRVWPKGGRLIRHLGQHPGRLAKNSFLWYASLLVRIVYADLCVANKSMLY